MVVKFVPIQQDMIFRSLDMSQRIETLRSLVGMEVPIERPTQCVCVSRRTCLRFAMLLGIMDGPRSIPLHAL
jgi:hypothetical protein